MKTEGPEVKLGSEIVQGAVTFEPGAEVGAVVPEISAPRLRGMMVEEKIEGNRLIERHREWLIDGEVQLLGIPIEAKKAPLRSPPAPAARGSHED